MSRTNTESGKLSIQYEPESTSKQVPLETEVHQLIQQRGAFRHITIQSLQDEDDQPAAVNEDALDVVDQEELDDEETSKERQERVWKSREDMIQKLGYVQNEILSALDFVSLMLSKSSPAAVKTMSPALQELVPKATLGSAVVKAPASVSKDTRKRLFNISDGVKLDSFAAGGDRLKQAAQRLGEEAKRQGIYWEQIAELRSQGWPVSRLPNDDRAIGVHYGSQEAAVQFRSRGFALVQQTSTGDVVLQSRSQSEGLRHLKYSLIVDGIEAGSYTQSTDAPPVTSSVGQQVAQARNVVFQAELFYEMCREARLVANQGVRSAAQVVEATLSPGIILRIAQTNVTEENNDWSLASTTARSVAVSASLLLLSEHVRNLERRSQPPPPMTLSPAAPPEYAILRPILTCLRHQYAVPDTMRVLRKILAPFEENDLGLKLTVVMVEPASITTAATSVQSLKDMATTSVRLTSSEDHILQVTVDTYLGAPKFGTTYTCDAVDVGSVHLRATSYNLLADLEVYVVHVLMLKLVSVILMLSKAGNSSVTWTGMRPHTGELTLAKGSKNVANVVVKAQTGAVTLILLPLSEAKKTLQRMAFMWHGRKLIQSSAGQQTELRDNSLAGVVSTIDGLLADL